MTGSWTFSRKLALGFAVIAVGFAIVAIAGLGLRTTQSLAANDERVAGLARSTRQTEAGATQALQTSSQLTSPSTSLIRLVQAT
jgi:hypothetical protein